MSRFALRLGVALLVALLATFPAFSRVEAHAALVRSEPADNSILANSPGEVRLWFNEVVSDQFSSVQVLDVKGRAVQVVNLHRDSADATALIFSLPELGPGVYSINWRVLSEADGHFTQGLVVFGVGEGADIGAVSAGESAVHVPPAEVVLRWLNFGSLAILAGAVVARFLVLGSVRPGADLAGLLGRVKQRVLFVLILATASAVIVGLGLLMFQTASLRQSLPEGVSMVSVGWQLISRSRWGSLWLARQFMLLIGAGLWVMAWRRYRDEKEPSVLVRGVAAVLSFAVLVVQALSGHAAALTAGTALAVIADSLHLIGVSVWFGGLVSLLIGVFPHVRRRRAHTAEVLRLTWIGFGRVSAPAVGLVVATGLYATGRQVASADALLSSPYGQALAGKVALVFGMAVFGALNAVLLHPRLARPLGRLVRRSPGWSAISARRLPVLVLAESGLGVLVVLAVSVLTATAPARGPEYAVVVGDLLDSVTEDVDDMLITFSAKPNKPGPNVMTLRVISQRRPPPAEVMRVIVGFTYLGADWGTVTADAEEQEPNMYRLGGSYFSQPGPWQVTVTVRRRGIEDTVAAFQWTVAPPGEPKPVVISDRPWEPLMTALAVVFLGLVLGGALLAWFLTRSRPLDSV